MCLRGKRRRKLRVELSTRMQELNDWEVMLSGNRMVSAPIASLAFGTENRGGETDVNLREATEQANKELLKEREERKARDAKLLKDLKSAWSETNWKKYKLKMMHIMLLLKKEEAKTKE